MRGFVFALIGFFIAGCAGVKPLVVEENWHQFYEPIESLQAINFVNEAYSEAVRLYGPASVQVREVHIRQSVKRRNPARFSRADIVDWGRFVSFLAAKRNEVPVSRLWVALSAETQGAISHCATSGRMISVNEQLALVDDLNRLLLSRSFYDPPYFLQLLAGNPGLIKLGARVDHLNPEKLERFNRQLLDAMFPARLALPLRERRWVEEGLELCELADPDVGRAVLYVSSPADAPEFYLQLAHETLHLLNPLIYDWHFEGLGNVFAEQTAIRHHLDWQPWQRHFAARRKSDPYAMAYFMMREIVEVAGYDMGSFLRCAVYSDQSKTKMQIDMDKWLNGLAPDKQARIREILRRYGPEIDKRRGEQNAFVLPAGLDQAR